MPTGAREDGRRRSKNRVLCLLANLQRCEQVNADRVQEIRDVNSLIRHSVIAASWAAHDAMHAGCVLQMGCVSAIETWRSDGAGRLRRAAHALIGRIDSFDDW